MDLICKYWGHDECQDVDYSYTFCLRCKCQLTVYGEETAAYKNSLWINRWIYRNVTNPVCHFCYAVKCAIKSKFTRFDDIPF